MKPFIVPIFVPHEGCPHRCLFCDQEGITGADPRDVGGRHVRERLEQALASGGFRQDAEPEIAFYGGTFTNLPLLRMKELLTAAAAYVGPGRFRSVRVSTRPDALSGDRLELMRRYGVKTVEVGAQSMDDAVLHRCSRGHRAEDTVKAVGLLKSQGFRVGMQLMPGLPGETRDGFRATVSKCLDLRPAMVRLYPAVVVRGTGLASLYEAGKYVPWSLDEAVEACAEACERFERSGVSVIRMGLMNSPALAEKGRILGGPWHPAFGFLVRARMFRKAVEGSLPGHGKARHIHVRVNAREIPLIHGYKNEGIRWILDKTGTERVTVEPDDTLPMGEVQVTAA